MRHIVVEGLPAAGKSEILELIARFYPEIVRVLPELVKEIVLREQLDLFRERTRLTEALLAALPRRRQEIQDILDAGFICLEESHLPVHNAYATALGDHHFVEVFTQLDEALPKPDVYLRLEIPVTASVIRQQARGSVAFAVDHDTLTRMLCELDRWHERAKTRVLRIDADRPAHDVLRDIEHTLSLQYGSDAPAADRTFDILFLLGRPASGKSELIDFLTTTSEAQRCRLLHIGRLDVVDDFPILWKIFEADDIWESLGRPRLYSKRCNGNYAVTDPGLWNFLIERINQTAKPYLTPRPGVGRSTLLIEFSRGGPTGYAEALAHVDPSILSRAAILYLDVSFEESWRRNVARYDEAARDGILTHSVPRAEMENTYGIDDWKEITDDSLGVLDIKGQRVAYATMCNEPESKDPAVLEKRYRQALEPLYCRWESSHREELRAAAGTPSP